MTSAAEHPVSVQAAFGGDAAEMRRLVVLLTPVIRGAARQVLERRQSWRRPRSVQQELDDLVQDVFVVLLADRGRALLSWDPRRGLSFVRFAALLAERHVAVILRTAKRSPWTEEPTEDQALTQLGGARDSHEPRITARQILARLAERLRAQVSAKGRQCFQLLFVEARSIPSAARALGLSAEALYAWKSRLSKLLRALGAELMPAREATPGLEPGTSAPLGTPRRSCA